MEATITSEQVQEPEGPPSDATQTPAQTFRFSSWVHVGAGAEQCPQAEGGCADPLHFHAWCRLPNQFQHQDIRERALAAKARRVRALRDPESDLHVILEADLGELRSEPNARQLMVEELVAKDWWRRELEAIEQVGEREEFTHIERDRERLGELRALEPERRPADELAELERHLDAYGSAVNARLEELERPVREATEALTDEELLEQVRERRIARHASDVFMESYSKWQVYAGTYTTSKPDRRRYFDGVDALVEADPPVVEALRLTFGELETGLHRGQRGN